MRRPPPRLLTAQLLAALVLAASCRSAPPRPEPLRISVPYDVGTLDPHARDTLGSAAITAHFYEPLVSADADLTIRPCLARLWENPDRSTWVFHLQSAARFHSGRPLRAADVVYSINRLLNDPGLEVAGYVLYVTEVSASDPLTVRIRTTRPPGVFLSKLRFVAIVPEGSTSESLAARPDGTGPYRIEEFRSRELVRMTRNEDYWGPRPGVAKVELLLNRSSQQAVADLLSGRSRLVELNSKALAARVRGDGRFEVLGCPSLFLKYIGFDLQRSVTPHVSVKLNPFLRKGVREAIHLAIDRGRLVSELSTEAIAATQPLPSSFVFGFNPRISPPPYDPARARALLREAGLGGGLRATLHVRSIVAEAARLVRDQLRGVGVELDVTSLPDEEFFELARRRELSLFLTRVGAGTGDGSDILETAIHSPDASRGLGGSNFGAYSSPEVDRAIESSAEIDSPPKRRQAIEAITARVMEDLPWVPLYVDQHVYAVDKGFTWRPRGDNCVLAAEIAPRGR